MLRKKIPKWVQDLEDGSVDKELLLQLAAASNNSLDTPREMNFALRGFKTIDEADNAAANFETEGWECRTFRDQSSVIWLEATKHDYMLDAVQLFEDEHLCVRIAKLYSVTYDGWYASVA